MKCCLTIIELAVSRTFVYRSCTSVTKSKTALACSAVPITTATHSVYKIFSILGVGESKIVQIFCRVTSIERLKCSDYYFLTHQR